MMKHFAALALCFILIGAGFFPIRASSEAGESTAVLNSRLSFEDLKKKPIYDNRAPSSSNLTGDKVTIDEENGIYSVVTASGTQMTLAVPFGACCITQDVYQQLDVYLNLFTDVSSALKFYISRGIHMDIYDFYAGNSTYIKESDDSLALFVSDLNAIEEDSIGYVTDYISKHWYDGHAVELKTVGQNRYLVVDLAESYGYVCYNHMTNGKLIEIFTFCDNGEAGMEQVEAVIETLTFGSGKSGS